MANQRKKTAKKQPHLNEAREGTGRHAYGQYHPRFCAIVLEMGKEGASECEMAVNGCGVPRTTMREWVKRYPDFRDALLLAKDHSLAWWETTGRFQLKNNQFNTKLWQKIVSSRFRPEYSERFLLVGDPDEPVMVHRVERVIKKADGSQRPID